MSFLLKLINPIAVKTIVYIIVFTAIGLINFKRKDILT